MQALIALGLCLAIACGVQTFRIGARDEQIALMKAEAATEKAAAEKERRELYERQADNARKAADTYDRNIKRAQAGAAGAISELDSLHIAINATSPAAPASAASGSTNGTGGLERELLGNCAAALVGMAQAAQRLEAKVIGLQDYVRGLTK